MSFSTLKTAIKTKLATISAISDVKDYPSEDFQSYPAVVVRTIGNKSDYETTHENQELYTFNLYLIFENSSDIYSKEKKRDIVEEVCDTIRDAFDSDEFLNGVNLPSDRQMLGIRPTVSEIDETGDGKYITAQIELAIRISKLI